MALRHVFDEIGQANAELRERGIVFRRQLPRSAASGAEERPKLVAASRVVVASGSRGRADSGSAKDHVEARRQDVGQNAHGFHTATKPVPVEPSVSHIAAYLLFNRFPSGSSLTQIAI